MASVFISNDRNIQQQRKRATVSRINTDEQISILVINVINDAFIYSIQNVVVSAHKLVGVGVEENNGLSSIFFFLVLF